MAKFLSSISTKIFLGYATVLLITIVTAVTIGKTNHQVQQEASAFVEQTLPQLGHLQTLAQTVKELEIAAYSLYGTTTDSAAFNRSYQAGIDNIESTIQSLRSSELKLDALYSQQQQLDSALQDINRIMSAGSVDWDAARNSLASLSGKAGDISRELRRLTSNVEQKSQASSKMMIDALSDTALLITLMIGIIIVVAVIAYVLARRQVAAPIQALSHTLLQVADNRDLTIKLARNTNDEVGQSADSVNGLLASFRNGLTEVLSAINGISGSVTTLSKTSCDSSQAVNNLKDSIHQLVSQMQTLQHKIQSGAERSVIAADIAERGASEVKDGEQQVTHTSDSISKLASDLEETATMLLNLRSSGDQVSSVVGTIAEIADQTNLLALNAAIEAARAGESGRGFAVVADEVRTLATKTHLSTVEINTILETIVSSITAAVDTMTKNQKQAQTSVTLAEGTVSSLAEIRNTILELSNECKQVATMSSLVQQEVLNATGEVTNFQLIGDTVSENSDKVETAAESLNQLASNLNQEVRRFKL
jgi:methyl-accepting chemotaxis protein